MEPEVLNLVHGAWGSGSGIPAFGPLLWTWILNLGPRVRGLSGRFQTILLVVVGLVDISSTPHSVDRWLVGLIISGRWVCRESIFLPKSESNSLKPLQNYSKNSKKIIKKYSADLAPLKISLGLVWNYSVV